MPKCPVCKTEYGKKTKCPECGFSDLSPVFISKEEGELWQKTTVLEWRNKHWKSLRGFEIEGKTLISYSGQQKDVSIPYGIEVIGEDAFKFNKTIVNVYCPETLKSIEYDAFFAASLQYIYLPEGLENIERNAFESSDLLAINIPSSCSKIGAGAFSSCHQLKSVIVSRGVKQIGEKAFQWCSNLSLVSIPDTVSSVENGAVSSGSDSLHLAIDPGNERYHVSAACLIDKKEKSIISGNLMHGIPQQKAISIIGEAAFTSSNFYGNCLKIPDNIERINHNAFLACKFTGNVYIPDSVRVVEEGAFFLSKRCSIFCEAQYEPFGWASNWCNANNYVVYWRNQWELVDGYPKLICLKTPSYTALLDSYTYDEGNSQLKLSIKLKNRSYLDVRFNFRDIQIDDGYDEDECKTSHYYVLKARSNVTCNCSINDSDFAGLYIRNSKTISFVTSVEDESTHKLLATGEALTLLGFGEFDSPINSIDFDDDDDDSNSDSQASMFEDLPF